MSILAYLSLGSNVGDRGAELSEARDRLNGLGRVAAISSYYETEPVEFTQQPWFLNCALALETDLKPEALMTSILDIERKMGRQRIQIKGPRRIDIDILLIGPLVASSPQLTIPHPAMQERRFVLQPLAEIASEMWHPVLNKTIAELLAALPAGQAVTRSA